MATIDSGSGRRGVRQTNHQLPLVPFIDFLICLVVFLLAQVGFANIARLQSNANVPGRSSDLPEATPKRLHVEMREHEFHVTWQSGSTVLASNDVPRQVVIEGRAVRRYPELAHFLTQDWQANGVHQSPNDPSLDEAVLHVQNSAAYEDVIAVLDALRAPHRVLSGRDPLSGKQASVFAVSFAVD
ncbi:MAG: biopolymer transporter ExbD [Polyangiaceae bacterium]